MNNFSERIQFVPHQNLKGINFLINSFKHDGNEEEKR